MSTIQRSGLQAAIAAPAPRNARVQAAIAEASTRTSVDFDYLMAQAKVESALDPSAKARTSSAAGLYQFTNQTWLNTLDRHGTAHGLGWAADAISSNGGRARITDPSMASAIMELRYNPEAASLMAGELAGDNAAYLQQTFGRAPDHTELYLAHFLGAAGAREFIAAHAADPGREAASLFPRAAGANRGVFYDKGRARSLGEVRELFANKLEKAGSGLGGYGPFPSHAGGWGAPAMQSSAGKATAAPAARPSMAQVLTSTFGSNPNSGSAPAHVASAYSKIARFGL
ncbi:transglycosylase SLT domain-containing protein [Aurantiacibacter suaedae]|uniref:transglycosylase SLT domain-containing protein n=1 Tax=Aurantiacibacter suaedae TaxID=2545755 RepID=UPI001F4FFECD|nr:transglycosylase SLT domain-containing protein [Aurantiacibacter suaedae]